MCIERIDDDSRRRERVRHVRKLTLDCIEASSLYM